MENTLRSASKQTLKLAVPILGSRILISISNFLAMLIIARLGHLELAAGAIVSVLFIFVINIPWAFLLATGIITAKEFGANKKEELGYIVRYSWLFGLILAIPVMIFIFEIGPILHLFHQQDAIIHLTQLYFRGIIWGVIPSILFSVNSQFVIATKKQNIILFWNTLGFPLLLIPGYLLTYGKFGLPNMGMPGMAYGYSFMFSVLFILSLIYLFSQKDFRPFKIFTFSSSNKFFYIGELFRMGFPIGVQVCAEIGAFAFITIMIGWLGQSALAAQQIVMQIGTVIVILFLGIGEASSILVGHAYGAKNYQAIRQYGYAGIIIGFIFTFIVAIVYYTMPKVLISCFLDIHNPNNIQTIHLATMLMAVVAISQTFDSIRNILTSILRGIFDAKIPMFLGILVIWGIVVPAGYFMAFKLHWGIVGMRAGGIIGFSLGAAVLFRRFLRKTSF